MIQRDIFKTIETRLNRAGENGTVILHGMPCVGKSTLMKQIAASRGSGYILADLTTDRELRSVLCDAINDSRHDSVMRTLSDFFGLSQDTFRGTLLLLDGAEYLQDSVGSLLGKALPTQCMIATDRFDYLCDSSATSDGICLRKDISCLTESNCFRIDVLSFSEFLSAIGRNEYREIIRARVRDNKPIPRLLREELAEHYYDYLMVGGFPQAVIQYSSDRTDIPALRMIHRQILSTIVQSINGAELGLPAGISTVRLNQIFGYLRDHAESTAAFRPGSVHRGLTMRDFANEFRYLQASGLLIPEYNIITDNGLQRFIANDYDTFYGIEQEHLPFRILRQSLLISCYGNGFIPVSYDTRKANYIHVSLPVLSLGITYTPHRRKSSTDAEITGSDQFEQIWISDDTSRNPDSNHNIMWYELNETLIAKKSLN